MTYDELYEQWRLWSHRTDLENSLLDFIFSMVIIKIGDDLRAQANEIIDTLALEDGKVALPPGFKKMRTVWDGRYYVDFVPPKQFTRGYYTLEAGRFLMDAEEAAIVYWGVPFKSDGDGSHDEVLNAHPDIYLYQGLAQIGRYLHDPSITVPNEQQYQSLINDINLAEAEARLGDNPVMR